MNTNPPYCNGYCAEVPTGITEHDPRCSEHRPNPKERDDEQSTTVPPRSFVSRVEEASGLPSVEDRVRAIHPGWDDARVTAEVTLITAGAKSAPAPSGQTRVTTAIAELVAAVQADADHELTRVNQALRDAGIEYPLGARGVADLAQLHQGALDDAKEIEAETAGRIATFVEGMASRWRPESITAEVLLAVAAHARKIQAGQS